MKRFWVFVGVLVLVAMLVWSGTQVIPAMLAATRLPTVRCDTCKEATQVAAKTQEHISLRALQAQATATADILRAHTLATANAAAATQGLALTQDQVNASALQAQASATAEVRQAQFLATQQAGNATQSVAQTQDKFNANSLQAQVTALAESVQANARVTQNAAETEAVLQQFRVQLTAAATPQPALSTATRTSARLAALPAAATANPTPIDFLGVWVAPLLIIVVAVFSVWGIAHWRTQAHNRILPQPPVDTGQSSPDVLPEILTPRRPAPKGEVILGRYQLLKPDGRQMRAWLDEVKQTLLNQRKDS